MKFRILGTIKLQMDLKDNKKNCICGKLQRVYLKEGQGPELSLIPCPLVWSNTILS